MRPAGVSGFLSCDETVRSCTVVKKTGVAKRGDVGPVRVPFEEEDENGADRVDDERRQPDEGQPADQAPVVLVAYRKPQPADLLADHESECRLRIGRVASPGA